MKENHNDSTRVQQNFELIVQKINNIFISRTTYTIKEHVTKEER
jgi:hypothetical protein